MPERLEQILAQLFDRLPAFAPFEDGGFVIELGELDCDAWFPFEEAASHPSIVPSEGLSEEGLWL